MLFYRAALPLSLGSAAEILWLSGALPGPSTAKRLSGSGACSTNWRKSA
jgi:hypothetical protein